MRPVQHPTDGWIDVVEHRGWDIVRLHSANVRVDVVPAKGADIVGLTWLPLDLDVLWHTPAGLRPRDATNVTLAADPSSETAFLGQYPGGWQTLFPNAGPSVVEQGVALPFHGEATRARWEWTPGDTGASVALTTTLENGPLSLRRVMTLSGDRLDIEETVTNHAAAPRDVMWGHHPAFGAPFLDDRCTLDTAAHTVVVDDERITTTGDLEPGARSMWPFAVGRDGEPVDLRVVPPHEPPRDRMGYLLDLDRGHVSIANPHLGVAVDLDWDDTVFPYVWYWLDVHASAGFPWYGKSYVLALEPHTSYPAQGLHAARAKTGLVLTLEPGESRAVTLSATLRRLPTPSG